MDLKTESRVAENVSVLKIGGEIELSNAAQLREALMGAAEAGHAGLVVDLAGVSFIDSTGIGVLVGALKRAREHGSTFVLAGAQRRVRRVFEITGLLGVFALAETVQDAIAQASAPAPTANGRSDDGGGGE